MYKKIGKIEKQMFEYHRANPALAQMDWSEARCFKEACNIPQGKPCAGSDGLE